MFLSTFTFGSFQVNNYVIACEETKEAALIDAGGFDKYEFNSFLKEKGFELKYILLTHGHLDHIAGAREIQMYKKARVYINKGDFFLLDLLEEQLSMYGMLPSKPPKDPESIEDNEVLRLGNLEIKVITTPGHSPGSVCYYIPSESKLFVGDTIFAQSVGRTDLPGGSYDQLMSSIREKIMVLPDDTEVYCGHGPVTSLGEEKRSNPFFGVDTPHMSEL